MNILVTGICGFVGSTVACRLLDSIPELKIVGIDNFSRPGSPTNISELQHRGIKVVHGDIRLASDFESLPPADFVIDCAANPSVLAGVDGRMSSRQLLEHNLGGTINVLEYCRQHRAGLILLSTSRVYSITGLASLPVRVLDEAYVPDEGQTLPPGITAAGLSEEYSTVAPVSLYGATRLASEALALEFGDAFEFPVYINRCGVLAGEGQFGHPEQGLFSFWIHSWAHRRPLRYLGFGGTGYQVRDCLHPADLVSLLSAQMATAAPPAERLVQIGGGAASAMSLKQLSRWCAARFGPHDVSAEPAPRRFDVPWLVLDISRAERLWNWRPARPVTSILEEIADHAERHPEWLELSAPFPK
jgi:CDP-paratose 2-epimerase